MVKILALTLCLQVFFLADARAAEGPRAGDWSSKIDSEFFQSLSTSAEKDFIVFLSEQADLSGAAKLSTKLEKGKFVFQQLTEVAKRSQSTLLRALDEQGVAYQSFWVANMVRVRGSMATVQQMAQRGDVARIEANPVVHFQEPVREQSYSPSAIAAIEPGLSVIKAPEVWALGFKGEGIVIGGADTGYRWTHETLIRSYRGWNGISGDHNYNWHDAIHSGGGACGPDNLAPCDDDGHGTHTMGTMVGDGTTDPNNPVNQIGVAPSAKWIGCRCMDEGDGTPATYTECFEWFMAPTDLSGNNPDPAKAPDIINNSWSCPPSEGCAVASLQAVIENVRAAGILVVASAGNSGSACSTVDDPPSIYDATFSIGATDQSDVIADFSSRGSVTVDGSGRVKPNVTAPGVGVRSSGSGSDNAYAFLSGTSMASPHVAGAAALLLSAYPALSGDVNAIELLLEQTALPRTTAQDCGGVLGTAIPNNTYGWGRIDALAALGLGDPDGDGMEDWQEILAGTVRTDPLSVLRITDVDRSGNDLLISFPSVLERRYRLERAAELETSGWSTVTDNVVGTGLTLQLSDPNALSEGEPFYRVLLRP